MLENLLWEKAAGVVLCSATLRALNNFNHFTHQVGLSINDGSRYLAMDSPFDFEQNATLFIPKMRTEPTDDRYTDELAEQILMHIEGEQATLVLFASYWQMEKVADIVRPKVDSQILIQGELSRQEILQQHKQK